MKYIKWLMAVMCLWCIGAAQAEDRGGAMAINGDMAIKLGDAEYKGRVSAALKPTAEGLGNGDVTVENFNLVVFDVPQTTITGQKPVGREKATLGFSLAAGDNRLKYDSRSQKLVGHLKGSVNVPGYIDPEARPIDSAKGEDGHIIPGLTQNATLKVEVALDKDLTNLIGVDKQNRFNGEMSFAIAVEADDALRLREYDLNRESFPVVVDFGWYFEVANHLCVQPVRIGRFMYDGGSWPPQISVQYTGDGLPFGQPGAVTEWKKADLIFTWNAWQTVFDNSLWAFSQSETNSLLGKVDDANCVEVFFVDEFTPSVFWGGGGTAGSGTADAKIISTDQNAEFGVDLTHLAHELGHAVSLCHPNDSNCEARVEMSPSSSGTLMCPSGFNNDNPAVNSVENKNNISNPLMTFSLKLVSAGPDCVNDADCGACP